MVDTWAPQLPKTLGSQGLGEDKGEKTEVMLTPPSPLLGFGM